MVPAEGGTFRLLFLDDVYDCHAVIDEGAAKNLLGFFQEIPLVLGQKEQIRPEFRAWCADLTYDLGVYKRFFDEQARLLEQEPGDVADSARSIILNTVGRTLFAFLDEQLALLHSLVKDFSPEEHERHGYYFRQQIWHFLMASEFMKRTNLKPRGYAGDAEMMQMIYDNAYVGRYAFNNLLHKHPLEQPAAQAVRNRRFLVAQALREHLVATDLASCRVLSVACGPARELEEIFTSPQACQRISVTLLDQDPEALESARQNVHHLEKKLGATIHAKFVLDSVRTMLRTRDLAQRLGRYDFIYSMGLFDYLTPPVARAVLAKVYELLEPGGLAVIGNFHIKNPSRWYMAYWHDWNLYYRTEEEMLEMAAGLGGAHAEVGFEPSGCQMFLRLKKQS